ncbi:MULTISPECIES: SH3 domain-containing protein [Allobacillus]|uniref:SH3 domain-containing protein n=1 Tax=Allobacillus TaxID=1400133 RepID=UPI001642B25F|nr:SH3 domain-containing protein [Allobacillus salarius]
MKSKYLALGKWGLALVLVLFCLFTVFDSTKAESQLLEGVALEDVTNVYSGTSKDTRVLKSYKKGSILLYRSYNNNWYITKVYLNGKSHTGYIYSKDVDTATTNDQLLEGISLKNHTNVYSTARLNSNVLKSYSQGDRLLYRSFTNDWYKTGVIVRGKRYDGYIHSSSVENAIYSPTKEQGIAKKQYTHVYSKASKGSKVLKSYSSGSKLRFETYTTNWFKATVYVNGKPKTGYIHISDVELSVDSSAFIEGISVNRAIVYAKPNHSSSSLKSYRAGTILKYQPYTDKWHKAIVYINGSKRIGYIPVSVVENLVNYEEKLRGIAINGATSTYDVPSKESTKVKTYPEGTVLQFNTLTKNWYQAYNYVNGKRIKVYIPIDQVKTIHSNQQKLNGIAVKKPTNAYSRASRNSSVVKTYSRGSKLIINTFTDQWYEATVITNGKRKKAYFHKDDVDTSKVIEDTTKYDKNFNELVDIWLSKNPQIWTSKGFKPATREDIEYYANPNNFKDRDSSSFFQYLVLSQPAQIDADELNNTILKNKGTLHGTGQAFVDAAEAYSVNEIYLLAHALHETGNGTSTLASGVKYKGTTVYNMYGINAKDSCPVECGASYAYKEGWNTPYKAVVGGAKFIGEGYINAGQDTLYKMRWNPDSPGNHQYATDVNWALAQTGNIAKLYSMLDNYTLFFDIPEYKGEPTNSTAYPEQTLGSTTSNVNFREKATTNSNALSLINSGTTVKLLSYERGQVVNGNNIWYRVNYNGKIGYIHSDYLNIENLGQVVNVTTNLNVRSKPVDGNVISSLKNSTFVSVALDKNGNMITKDNWYKINVPNSNKTGWVSGDYFKVIK